MALVTQSAGLVRQKAYNAVYGGGKTASKISPFHFYAIKAFFIHMAMNKQNPDLQFLPFTSEQAVTNLGVDLVGAASTLYYIFAVGRRTSGTTAAFLSLNDAADNSATTATVFTSRFNASGQSVQVCYPDGLALATGAAISAATTVGGPTESSAADGADGFVIVGA
jgi:hypothetical protein